MTILDSWRQSWNPALVKQKEVIFHTFYPPKVPIINLVGIFFASKSPVNIGKVKINEK